MRQRRGRDRRVARWQLLDRTGSEAGEILRGAAERGERRTARLVRKRNGHLGPCGECLEERPLRAREVLEAVGEDGFAVPGVEIRSEPLDSMCAEQATVPSFEPVELLAVSGVELAELAVDGVRRQQSRFELVEHLLQRVHEARTLGGAGEAPQVRAAHDTTDDERLLGAPKPGTAVGEAACEIAEYVLERPDLAAEERRAPGEQLQLDAVDVRPVRHDQERLEPVRGVERGEIAVEQKLDLARVGGPRDESERHPPTLARSAGGAKSCALRPGMTVLRRRRRGLPSAPCREHIGLGWGSDGWFVAGEQALRARPLVRGVVTCRYAAALAAIWFETVRPLLRERPEAKTAAQRRLSRRPDCARAGLCRARAHDSGLPPKRFQLKGTKRGRDRALARAEFLPPASEAPASLAKRQ